MKKILISGASGFIGSHLCDFFLENNYKVIGIENFLSGSIQNIKHILNHDNFTFIEKDICEKIFLKDQIDYLLHFASPASPNDYLKYPLQTLRIGSIGTENMLRLAMKNNATILVASTSEIYGDPLVHPQSETYFGNVNPIGPRGVYDEAKRYLEALTIAYKNKKKVSVRIARIFNTYGPRMRKNDGRAIPNFINQALNNEDFTIYGDGSQTRSFCYIDDTVSAIVKLLLSKYQLPVNIGNPNEISILNLTKKINKILGKNSKLIFTDLPENDPKSRNPDISLAKKVLGWSPKINLEDGLDLTIKFYKKLSNFEK